VTIDPALATEAYCYLTTTGRVSGKAHTIEIWFALVDDTAYLLAGAGRRSDWVRNLLKQPHARLRIAQDEFDATGRLVGDTTEDALVRRLLVDKYQPGHASDLTDWGRTALPVALALTPASA
jgi:deazaflavin-dependent oxidoreductase (nitroreductase family)